ncbi:MAG: aminopeptidase [Acidobacteria bacterium]|nr:aminopeptidase [Acidobacteriota bacterium]
MRRLIGLVLLGSLACGGPETTEMPPPSPDRHDLHSYSNADEIRTTHIALDWTVDFDTKTIGGSATLTLQPVGDAEPSRLILDTRALTIRAAAASVDGDRFTAADFRLGPSDPVLGAPLTIQLPEGATHVRVEYLSDPGATGLQWLEPAMTAGKQHPYLFSQSQAIHARSWIPLQDTPGVRATYEAVVRTPPELVAVMSAEMLNRDTGRTGEYRFEMPQAIPSYLIALAVGDIDFRAISDRTGVWAEPSVVESAASEFEDLESMMQAAEKLFGPYRWGRYDVLVLPPSFPFGGMENPRLTFATPTLLAGDKSLVGVIAHELAHSWSGNLVTNATWRDFWLNEGFTVYLENRIQEEVFGAERANMEAALEVQDLEAEMAELAPRDQVLHVDLTGRDPDEGFTQVPYIKGMLLLRTMEHAVGREQFDAFLRGYFDHFAFQSITTADFEAYLKKELPAAAEAVPLETWLNDPGLPADAVRPTSGAFEAVEAIGRRWVAGEIPASEIPWNEWNTHERLRLLASLPKEVGPDRMAELDKAFSITQSRNAEIIHRWLLEATKRGYKPAEPRVEQFLLAVGRRKFLKPLYEALAETPEGKKRALAIYKKARAGYHPIAQQTIDQILGVKGE